MLYTVGVTYRDMPHDPDRYALEYVRAVSHKHATSKVMQRYRNTWQALETLTPEQLPAWHKAIAEQHHRTMIALGWRKPD